MLRRIEILNNEMLFRFYVGVILLHNLGAISVQSKQFIFSKTQFI